MPLAAGRQRVREPDRQQTSSFLPLALECGRVGWEVSPGINKNPQAAPIMGVKS